MSKAQLSTRVSSMKESATIAMSQRSREMKAQGLDIINLSIGEPDFFTHDIVKEAAKEAIDGNYSKYTPVPGYLELRETICEKFETENNLTFTPNQVTVSTGAKQCIANVILALINSGDEVVLPAPYWVSYTSQVQFAGGKTIEINTSPKNNFKITAEQLESAISEKTKLIIYSSPCNPSGAVYSENELKDLAKVISNHPNLIILSDEIYEYINFTDNKTSLGSIESIKNQVVTVNGLAKGHAMTGWRIGFMGGPIWLIQACNKIQGQFTSGTNSIAQRAAITALKNGKELSIKMKKSFQERRDYVYKHLKEMEGVNIELPDGAFYMFPDVSYYIGKQYENYKINNTNDLCLFLLEEGLVACVGGESFGSPDCIRLSYASSKEILAEALKRIKNTLKLLH